MWSHSAVLGVRTPTYSLFVGNIIQPTTVCYGSSSCLLLPSLPFLLFSSFPQFCFTRELLGQVNIEEKYIYLGWILGISWQKLLVKMRFWYCLSIYIVLAHTIRVFLTETSWLCVGGLGKYQFFYYMNMLTDNPEDFFTCLEKWENSILPSPLPPRSSSGTVWAHCRQGPWQVSLGPSTWLTPCLGPNGCLRHTWQIELLNSFGSNTLLCPHPFVRSFLFPLSAVLSCGLCLFLFSSFSL